MASIRTDGTIWQAMGKRKESESGGLLKRGGAHVMMERQRWGVIAGRDG